MRKDLIIPAIFTLIILSCQKNNAPFTDTPVIESYLSPGQHPVVKISRQIPFSSDVTYSTDNIDSLTVMLESESNSWLLKPAGDSIYTDTTIIIEESKEYSLSFVFNSKTVSAYTTVPPKPEDFTQSATSISVTRMDSTTGFPSESFEMPSPVELKWKNDDASYYIVVIENMETTPDPIRSFSDSTRPNIMFRERPTTASGLELRPQEFQYFGKHRIILYHVLPDYASLYDNRISSSQNLTNPSTSITNGYGIFTGLNADTLFLQVNEASK